MTNFAAMMCRPRTDRMHKAAWTNGKSAVSGWWEYHWPSDRFVIILDQRDRTTGARQKTFTTCNDTPEWAGSNSYYTSSKVRVWTLHRQRHPAA